MNKIDKFFKKKVEDFVLEPRPEAWDRLEANLSKKNKGLIWFKTAAALLLMGLFITSIIWLNRSDVSKPLAEQAKTEKSLKPIDELGLKKDNLKQSTHPNKINNNSIKKKKTNSQKQKTNETHNTPQIVKETPPEVHSIETIKTETVAAASVVEKIIVIEYTLETVKYLKKETPVVAETTEKKNSLQKAIDFAREAKNSDSPLGGLRQAKDELFALNFNKKDKQKN